MTKINRKIANLKSRGENLAKHGKLSDAKDTYLLICELDSRDYESHVALGVICGMLKNFSDAILYLHKAAEICPTQPDAYYNLGIAYKSNNDIEKAAACYKMAIRYQPNNAACHNNLGNIFLEQRELDAAIACFNNAMEISPDSYEYHYNIGIALKMRGLRTSAQAELETSLCLRPDFIPALKALGTIHSSQGNLVQAEECFKKILSDFPEDEDAISGLANVISYNRDHEKALELLSPYLGKPVISATIALAYARISKHIDNHDTAIKLLESALLNNGNPSKDNRAQIHFMLGYFYDKEKKYKRAFEHYRIANKLRMPKTEPSDNADTINQIISSFNESFCNSSPCADTTSDLPIFIIGMPRSGTSLVEQILASHPDIYGAGELDTLSSLLETIPARVGTASIYPDSVNKLNKHLLNEISQEYLTCISEISPTALRITDKMPGNFLNLGFIKLLFPNARIIHCRRNPLDTCLSCYFQDFDGHQYATNLATLGRFYRQYARIMDYWNNVLNINILTIDYEKLTNNFNAYCKNLISFCGLDWDDACLDFHMHERIVVTASMDQVNKPVNSRSVNRWMNYEAYIGDLKNALLD